MILGVIADDYTGATDVAGMLVRAGMKTVQVFGVPQQPLPQADAVVVALKSRTVPAADAVAQSLAAAMALENAGVRQLYFKYCSTFDSTAQGNIGPVIDALLAALDTRFTIACPALPENGRTVYQGHLFVGDTLLSESGMRQHPLTPMTDANLCRVLQAQTKARVGLLPIQQVRGGALPKQLGAARAAGVEIAIVDALTDDDLLLLAEAVADLPLVTAGSGLAIGLPAAYARRGWLVPDAAAQRLDVVGGGQAVVSGSCSTATQAQVARWLADGRAAFRVDALAACAGPQVVTDALQWARSAGPQTPLLVYATAAPEQVRAAQQQVGASRAGEAVENTLASIARGLVEGGVRRLVVAGGETSGAVVKALGVRSIRIGASIAPGVPWTQVEGAPLLLALKSGNFGDEDFFAKALSMVD